MENEPTREATILERLRALSEEEACQLLRDPRGIPLSRQYLWEVRGRIRPGRSRARRPPQMSFRLFARAVSRLGLGEPDCPIVAELRERFPDEFAPVKAAKLVRPRKTA